MRTAIFLAGMFIHDAILQAASKESTWDNGVITFTAILFVILALMDLIEFLHSKRKS